MIRLNDNGRHPNPRIYFIKPLTRQSPTDLEFATQTLNRLAAVVFPIMKQNGLIVKSLTEHEYNSEFLGRNYNAGEIVELVLRNSRGDWLPESFVLSVLLHELSHCTNMNHGRLFWSTLATYKQRMQELIQKGYTGEGFWGRGQTLTGYSDQSLSFNLLPTQICGGTFRRSRKARKQIKVRMRSIPKKFSDAGEGLKVGEDLEKRIKLTGGKVHKGKPRVAQSKRGNELRLNAALARVNSSNNTAAAGFEASSSEKDDGELIFVEDFDKDDFEFQIYEESNESREKLKKEWMEDLLVFKRGGESDVIVID